MCQSKTPRVIITPEEARQINDLISHGFSYSRIGDMVGKSKSAIAGFVFRANHKKPPSERKLNPNKSRATAIKNIIPDMPIINQGITIFELKETTCRYMIGDHRYCGQDVVMQSYCESHAKECYVTPKKRWR